MASLKLQERKTWGQAYGQALLYGALVAAGAFGLYFLRDVYEAGKKWLLHG